MAKVYIAEFSAVYLQGQALPYPRVPPIAEQTVAIGATSVQSSAFNAATKLVQIETDAICSLAFGANPTATANNMRLAANDVRSFCVNAGDKVAVITNS